jgi:hypothetical protein
MFKESDRCHGIFLRVDLNFQERVQSVWTSVNRQVSDLSRMHR